METLNYDEEQEPNYDSPTKEELLDLFTFKRLKYSDFFKDINIKEEEIYNVN